MKLAKSLRRFSTRSVRSGSSRHSRSSSIASNGTKGSTDETREAETTSRLSSSVIDAVVIEEEEQSHEEELMSMEHARAYSKHKRRHSNDSASSAKHSSSMIMSEFSNTGRVLTEKEKIHVAEVKGYCLKCGIRTHKGNKAVRQRPLTNDEVWKGICIKCHPSKVPTDIRQQYYKNAADGLFSSNDMMDSTSKSYDDNLSTASNADYMPPYDGPSRRSMNHTGSAPSEIDVPHAIPMNNRTSNSSSRSSVSSAATINRSSTRSSSSSFPRTSIASTGRSSFNDNVGTKTDPKFNKMTVQTYMEARRKVTIPQTAHQKVLESMKIVSEDLHGVGMDFFVGIFQKYPEIKQLFPFGMDIEDMTVEEIRNCKRLQLHAYKVMETLASVVGGLQDFQALIPALRELGLRHITWGILPEHYDMIFDTLIDTIAKRVMLSNTAGIADDAMTMLIWTKETREAWEICYDAIKSVMKDPKSSKHLELEHGMEWGDWGLYHTLSCLYFCLATPYRIAMNATAHSLIFKMWTIVPLVVAIFILALDSLGEQMQSKMRDQMSKDQQQLLDSSSRSTPPVYTYDGDDNNLKQKGGRRRLLVRRMSSMMTLVIPKSNDNTKKNKWIFYIRFKLKRILRRLKVLNQREYWNSVDLTILACLLLEWFATMMFSEGLLQTASLFICGATQCGAGLCRLFNFWNHAEIMTLQKSASSSTTTQNQGLNFGYQHMLLLRLVILVVYVVHVFACTHLLVAESQQSYQRDQNPPFVYLGAIYWAFVNVTGMGNDQAEPPATSFEIVFTLLAHVAGLVLYFLMAGQCLGFVQNHVQTVNKIEEAIQSLTTFMDNCDIPKSLQSKFLSNLIMQHQRAAHSNDGINTNLAEHGDHQQVLQVPPSALQLPAHLSMELTLFARAKALRTHGLSTIISEEFAIGLAGMLVQNVSLLAGDYLMKVGQKTKPRVWMVDQGSLEVSVDGISKGRLYPGDLLGKGWLTTQPMEAKDTVQYKAYMDWRSPEGVAIADIRCMSPCRLIMGIRDMSEVAYLRRTYPEDMEQLTNDCTPAGALPRHGG